MGKNKNNKDIVKNIQNILERHSITTIGSKLFVFDLALLELTQEKGLNYIEKHHLYPGYSKFFASLGILYCKKLLKDKPITDQEIIQFNKLLDLMSQNNLEINPIYSVDSMALAQRDWQRYYPFKTYLIYLFLNNSKIKPILNSITNNSVSDFISICLAPKILSEPIILGILYEMRIPFSKVFDKLKEYIIINFPYLIISINDFKAKQLEKIEKASFNLFASRMLVKDYPIVRIYGKFSIFSSFFYIQDALFSRTIREIAKKGQNSKLIGDVFEDIIFNQFVNYYGGVDSENGNKKILLNPSTKNSGELCDVMLEKGNDTLLIDCKAKELIEEVYINNSQEFNVLVEKFQQRIKRIQDIKNGKFNKYYSKGINLENIYSIIVMTDDGVFPKNYLFDKCFPDLTHEEKEYYNKHIHIISYEDLIESITTNVDLIEIIKRSIRNNNYGNHLRLNIKNEDKSPYNTDFDKWYKSAFDDLTRFLLNNKII